MISEASPCIEEKLQWTDSDRLNELAEPVTILLVEDEEFVRQVTSEVLRSAGYHVMTARNAAEAEAAFRRAGDQVNLLLTDVVLPGESGCSLSMKLRRLNPQLKVLLVTGYAEQLVLQQSDQERCLAKPFSRGVLLESVRQLLDSGSFEAGRKCA